MKMNFGNLRNRVDTYKYSPLIFFSLFTSPKLDIGLYGTKRLNRLCSLHLRAKVTKRHYIFFICLCKVNTRHDKLKFLIKLKIQSLACHPNAGGIYMTFVCVSQRDPFPEGKPSARNMWTCFS